MAHLFSVDVDAIGRGLCRVKWPARLQRIEGGRLPALLPEGWELWLDGGHNPGAASVLARHLMGWRDRPVYLVFGMLVSKDAEGFLATLSPYVDQVATIPVPGQPASLDAEEAAAIAARQGIRATAAKDISGALKVLAETARTPTRILVCGSLYLAGAVLTENEKL